MYHLIKISLLLPYLHGSIAPSSPDILEGVEILPVEHLHKTNVVEQAEKEHEFVPEEKHVREALPAQKLHEFETEKFDETHQKSLRNERVRAAPEAEHEQTMEHEVFEEETSNASILRWGYWFIIFYMFIAQATVCDEYFVESIKVIVEKYNIPEDVAGATLMALGCNGPELATNCIALFITHSDVGVGTIVGSEIFNILTIIAGCAIVSPTTLEINPIPFYRDSFFYALSIGLLMWVLQDGQVEFHEALMLLGCGVLFATTVASTAWMVKKLGLSNPSPNPTVVLTVPVEEEHDPSDAESIVSTGQKIVKQIGFLERRLETNHNTTQYFQRNKLRELMKDNEVEVSVQRHNRLSDANVGGANHAAVFSISMEEAGIFIDLGADDEVLGAIPGYATASIALGIRPKGSLIAQEKHERAMSETNTPRQSHQSNTSGRGDSGRAPYSKNSSGMVVLSRTSVRRPSAAGSIEYRGGNFRTTDLILKPQSVIENMESLKKPLLENQTGNGDGARVRQSNFTIPDPNDPAIRYKDISRCMNHGPNDFQLDIRGDWSEIVSLQIYCKSTTKKDEYIEQLKKHNVQVLGGGVGSEIHATIVNITDGEVSYFWKFWGLFCFPINVSLALTLTWCDPTNPTKQDRWLSCFCISMCWLAFYSYVMVWTSDQISDSFGISPAVLGVTVCAVGTSFPNWFASILMAKDGRSSMAVSNALGSNVQNVFLALAVPWILRTTIPDLHPIPMSAKGIFEGVCWMAGTLILLLVFVIVGDNRITRNTGFILLAVYAVYLWRATHS